MDFTNCTPFPHLVFESHTPAGRSMGVVVLRGTFRIVPGAPLLPVPEQAPVALRDVYRGERGSSSLLAAADTAPSKPRADIHVNAIARAPGGKPAAAWPVRIRVGTREKALLVRGPHAWRHRRLLGWTRTEPRPCREVVLSYENAFGGSFAIDGQRVADGANPVGTGWIPRCAPKDEPIRAPQVVALDEPEHVPGERYRPEGCGPMPGHWAARAARARTSKGPAHASGRGLPGDLDESFHNSAHPDLVYDGYLAGGEEIELVGLTAHAPVVRTSVPRCRVYAWVTYENGIERAVGLALDTLQLDVAADNAEHHRASLTWRARYPWPERVARLQVRGRDLERAARSRVAWG